MVLTFVKFVKRKNPQTEAAPESKFNFADHQNKPQTPKWINTEMAPVIFLLEDILEELQNKK